VALNLSGAHLLDVKERLQPQNLGETVRLKAARIPCGRPGNVLPASRGCGKKPLRGMRVLKTNPQGLKPRLLEAIIGSQG
jgi:hypothetical protein